MNQLFTSIPYLAWLAPIALLWSQIKEFLTKLVRLLIVEVQVNDVASTALLYYLRAHAKQLPTNVKKYNSRHEYVLKTGAHQILLFEGMKELKNQWFWLNETVVSVSDRRGTNKDTGISTDQSVSVRYLRGTLDIEQVVLDAIKWYEGRDALTIKYTRFYVERKIGKEINYAMMQGNSISESKETPRTASSTEDYRDTRIVNYRLDELGYASKNFFYVYNDKTRRILDDVAKWQKSKTWYSDRGILWRRGALLWSLPGAGKSSLIRKIGQTLDLPVISFDLSTMNDEQFIRYWEDARNNGSCIVVFEDIDTVWHKREAANPKIRLSFECLLNCISGVQPAEGVYLFVTTNHLEHIDDALGVPNNQGVSTRPGRLDVCFELTDITEIEKREIAKHFLSGYDELIETLIVESNGCTAAQFSDLCSQHALQLYWEGQK